MSEPDVTDLLTVSQAIAIIDGVAVNPRVQRLRLEQAQGLRLAHDVRSDRDYPPFDKSLMDGYAVRCADIKAAPVELEVIGEIAAGQRPARPLKAGEAIAIMTGAPMPGGADGVVPVEETRQVGNRVRIARGDGADRFIAKRGADCISGAIVLPRGTRLESAQLAVAGSVGAAEVEVFSRPRVAVLSTGDELVSIDAAPGPSQIRNSNNLMLVALMHRVGADVTDLGSVRDDPDLIREQLRRGIGSFDVLLVTGGMSMGRYDYVPRLLIELGVDLKITKLRIKPGKPFVFGLAPNSFVFGLPGNPVSSFVCAVRFCARLIARMSGGNELDPSRRATIQTPLERNGPREFYQPAILRGDNVAPLKWRGSADIYTLAMANALIVRPENAPPLETGARVDVLEVPR